MRSSCRWFGLRPHSLILLLFPTQSLLQFLNTVLIPSAWTALSPDVHKARSLPLSVQMARCCCLTEVFPGCAISSRSTALPSTPSLSPRLGLRPIIATWHLVSTICPPWERQPHGSWYPLYLLGPKILFCSWVWSSVNTVKLKAGK